MTLQAMGPTEEMRAAIINDGDKEFRRVNVTVKMDRRELLTGLAAGTVVPIMASGCSTNAALDRQQIMLVSDGQLAQLAAGSWRQALSQTRQTRDYGKRRRVEQVGTRIVDAADKQFPARGLTKQNWEFAVFDEDTINAWVMPGGKVGFYTGILDIMSNDDQVATVMGHEVGHVVGRHAAERMSQQLVGTGVIAVGNIALDRYDVKHKRELGALLGAGVTFGYVLPYSRLHEYEADRLGVDFMNGGSYRPPEALTFWQNMMRKNQGRARPLEWMSTHPSDGNRIARMRSHIASKGYGV